MSTLPEVLLSKRVVTESGCWEWAGPRDSNGYGRTRWDGKNMRVHRLVAHLAHGLDLANPLQYARHDCDNPPCFNPAHIQPGTPRDNQQDAIRRARRIKAECKRGHPFTAENVKYEPEKGRRCRACDNERNRAYSRRQLEKGVIPYGARPATCDHCGKVTSLGYLKDHVRRMHPEATA